MSTEDRSAEEIRAEIEQTREEVGETVEALAAKSDVKAQAHQRVDEVKANVRARAEEAKAKAKGVTPQSAQEGGAQVAGKVRENPTPLIAGAALVAAFLLGRRSRRR
jgi:hypothetical protein